MKYTIKGKEQFNCVKFDNIPVGEIFVPKGNYKNGDRSRYVKLHDDKLLEITTNTFIDNVDFLHDIDYVIIDGEFIEYGTK